MNVMFKLPPFGKFLDMLNAAGIGTKSARGFWGGVNDAGEIVMTAWIDFNDGAGRFYIWRPRTNHGGLKDQWDIGNVRVGTEVRLIILRPRQNIPMGQPGRSVAGAVLMPGKWRIVELVADKNYQGIVEPAPAA